MSKNNKKKNKATFCTNCGKVGHEYRMCAQPTTSYGVILVNINSEMTLSHNPCNLDNILDDQLNKKIFIYSSLNEKTYKSKTTITNSEDCFLCSTIIDCISFLMISRKHSLGYVEFVRGRYKVEKMMQLIYLFKFMTLKEIKKIKHSLTLDNGFDFLWEDLWGKKALSSHLESNRKESKVKYEMIKYISIDGPEIGLSYLVDNVSPQYDIDEWGFPKGRRNKNETDRDCAVREFMEESGYYCDDFKIIDEIEPIVEEFVGTNGVVYRHIYYIAELIKKKVPKVKTDQQNDEVGNITFMNLNTATQTIRPYHKEKINLLTSLTEYYFDIIYKSIKKVLDEKKQEQH